MTINTTTPMPDQEAPEITVPDELTAELNEQVFNVARLRIALQQFREMRKGLLAELETTDDWIGNEQSRKVIERELKAIEDLLRQTMLEGYSELGIKALAPGLNIKIGKSWDYEIDDALKWCRKSLKAAVIETVDRPTFEAAMTAMPDKMRPDFVTRVETPKATIASDLTKHIEDPEALDSIHTLQAFATEARSDKYPSDWGLRRARVLERDQFQCQRCQVTYEVALAEGRRLDVHHKIAIEDGGTHEQDNLVTLCAGKDGCHMKVQSFAPPGEDEAF